MAALPRQEAPSAGRTRCRKTGQPRGLKAGAASAWPGILRKTKTFVEAMFALPRISRHTRPRFSARGARQP
ncbi:hypothetical protein LH427_02655 [Laribacter hongkongensis]|nr:hypothetical protein [Laribacter hongkongensis]MCG9004134.1 hypothetical protein [Laribacter hongkongensis]MCG9015047.1 hypothetical protein [Laribacter hongkongensis]MCG9019103.1 hypothetical protein [Laribacter hongkongensis]MCG9027812.1 hypothetical protein [Laribacter hongkongensis]